jgi:hypothetical protein
MTVHSTSGPEGGGGYFKKSGDASSFICIVLNKLIYKHFNFRETAYSQTISGSSLVRMVQVGAK